MSSVFFSLSEGGLLKLLTNLAKGYPVDAIKAAGTQREADGCAYDGVSAGDGQLEERGN